MLKKWLQVAGLLGKNAKSKLFFLTKYGFSLKLSQTHYVKILHACSLISNNE